MNRQAILAISSAFVAAFAAACTVKENRSFCPAWCVIYSNGHVADGCNGELMCSVETEEQGSVEYGNREFSRFTQRGDLVLEVPRNEQVYVDVFCGVRNMEKNGSVLAIPMGFCCDSIYAGHSQVFISGEEGETGLPLNKDYALIEIRVTAGEPVESPFYFRVIGNVDGYELPGGAPHRGEFDYTLAEGRGSVFRALLPRQMDDSLLLDIYNKDDSSLVSRQKLGEILREKGYEWNVPDLPDIGLEIDIYKANFSVSIQEWGISETIRITF